MINKIISKLLLSFSVDQRFASGKIFSLIPLFAFPVDLFSNAKDCQQAKI